jgi:prepilin-type N-terminal cleavage/methylation domain-containing protein
MAKSFTLIELLIAVVIIALLATLAIPQYNSMIIKSKAAEAINMLDAIRKAELAYHDETREWLRIMYADSDAEEKWNKLGVKTTQLLWHGRSFPGASKYFLYSSVSEENAGGSKAWFGAWYIDPQTGQPHMPGNFSYSGQDDSIYMDCENGKIYARGLFIDIH